MACEVNGDSDLYGLGVRLGLYLTGVACILARIFAPTRAGGLTSGLHVLTFALNLTLLKNVLQGRPAMLELYMVMALTQILTLMLVLSGAIFSGVTSAAASVLVVFSQFVVTLWVAWNKRLSGLDSYPPGCARTVRFFGAVDVTGPFGTFLAVFPLVVLAVPFALLLLILLAMHCMPGDFGSLRALNHLLRESLRNMLVQSDPIVEWIGHVGLALSSASPPRSTTGATDSDGQGGQRALVENTYKPIPLIHAQWDLSSAGSLARLVFALALAVWSAEDTLRLSDVRVDSNLLSTGQLLPLIVGFVSVLSVFAGWLNDRLLNLTAERLLSDRVRLAREPALDGPDGGWPQHGHDKQAAGQWPPGIGQTPPL